MSNHVVSGAEDSLTANQKRMLDVLRRRLTGEVESKCEAPLICYGELAKLLGRSARGLDGDLYAISKLSENKGLPLLSSIVVNKQTKRPGNGYWEAFGDRLWEEQIERIIQMERRGVWSSL